LHEEEKDLHKQNLQENHTRKFVNVSNSMYC